MRRSFPPRRIGGAICALVTPFCGGELDTAELTAHVEWQLLNGIDGLLACSLTGEGPVLTETERSRIIDICVGSAEGQVPVIVATGTNDTAATIMETRQAQRLGADAAFITLPYYSKPTQKGIVQHVRRISDATDLPFIIHNSPAHTAIDLTPATVAQLADIPAVIGIADGTGDIGRIGSWQPLLPEWVGLYSTHDATALAFAVAGGRGSFSNAANVVPRLYHALQHAAGCDHLAAARIIDDRLQPLFKALARESEPATIKHALALLTDASREVRLPLVGVEAETDAAIRAAIIPFQHDRQDHAPDTLRVQPASRI